jgi:hypothetical protein
LLAEWLLAGALYAQAPVVTRPGGESLARPPIQGAHSLPVAPAADCGPCGIVDGCGACGAADGAGFYAGAEFLLMRVHFSEAIAFVRVTDTPTGVGLLRQTRADELDFDYEPSFRVFLGYQWDTNTSLRASYWHFNAGTSVSGAVDQVNQTIVDPFGNRATVGQAALATAGVEMNVYDLDLVRTTRLDQWGTTVYWAAGARLADIYQDYDVGIALQNGPGLTRGDFRAEFLGAGPHFEVSAYTWGAGSGRFALYGRTGLALLIGEYDVSAGANVPAARIEQAASRTRAVPVVEAELGAAWRPMPNLTISTGWQFQSWFNVGTSGGQFGGAFLGTDDADIMSFDGLVVRAEFRY